MSASPAGAAGGDGTDESATGGLGRSLGHAWLIARIELRRSWRRMGDNPRQLVGIAIAGLFFLPVAAVAVAGAYSLGTAAGTDAFAERLSIARLVVSGVVALVAFMVALATVQEYGELEQPATVLTAVPHREAVWGLLLLNFVSFAGIGALPVLAVAVAFALGAGSPASVATITVALLAVVAFSITVGFVAGQATRIVGARVAFVARYKTVIGALAFVAYFALFATGAMYELADPVIAVLEATPLGWFADLALVAAPDPAIGVVRPAAAAAILLVGTALLTRLAVRLSGALWYTEAVQPDAGDADDRDAARRRAATGDVETIGLSRGLSERLFGGRVPRPTLRVAQKSWRRAYRAPLKLQYAAVPAFFLLTPIQQSFEAGEVSSVLPVSIAIYGAWASGAAFTLNPLGDEGAVLPITLTSGVSGRRLLGGLVFAGVAVGGPPTVLLALGLGLASPLGAFSALVTAALGGVLCVGACAIGAGIGTAFPKFEKTRLSRSRRAIVPGLSAFVVYSLVLLVVTLPGLLAGVPALAELLGGWVGVSARAITLAGLATTTLLAGVAAWVGFRSAAETIDGYTPAR